MHGDEELFTLLPGTIRGGGVVPHIIKVLVPQKKLAGEVAASKKSASPKSAKTTANEKSAPKDTDHAGDAGLDGAGSTDPATVSAKNASGTDAASTSA